MAWFSVTGLRRRLSASPMAAYSARWVDVVDARSVMTEVVHRRVLKTHELGEELPRLRSVQTRAEPGVACDPSKGMPVLLAQDPASSVMTLLTSPHRLVNT